jgi:glycosyltransferase involved in cell wall biosynthesis
MNLYITADKIGQPNHGGGSVTYNESEALKILGECEIYGHDWFVSKAQQGTLPHTEDWNAPWFADNLCEWHLNQPHMSFGQTELPKLAHFYAGTFTRTIQWLKQNGCKVTYMAAAHDVEKSKKAHEELGFFYNYPHLTDPELWKRYLGGYLAADVLIVPSQHSKSVMQGFGALNRIEVIPHGVHLPESIKPLPQRFRVGYLGSYGPDKGVKYLLEAWRKLNYSDATLVLGGRDSQSEFVQKMCHAFGGGAIELRGWVDNVSDFYDGISLYVQPSVTEGFGLEVPEAMAHGRAVLCSRGAGAVDLIPEMTNCRFNSCNSDQLAEKIDWLKKHSLCDLFGNAARCSSSQYTWDKIREKYVSVWKELLNG